MYGQFLKNSKLCGLTQLTQKTETGRVNGTSRDHNKQCYDWFRPI